MFPPAARAAVDYNGIRVIVPAGWSRNAEKCGTPIEDTVIVDHALEPVEACAVVPRPVSYVWLYSNNNLASDHVALVAMHPGNLQGHAVRRGEDRLPDGRTRTVIVVPEQRFVLVAVSKDQGLARGIAASLRFTPPSLVAVRYHGIQVLVPAEWPRNRLWCDNATPTADTVIIDPGPTLPMPSQDCPERLYPNPVSYVWLRAPANVLDDPEVYVASDPVRLQGHTAARGEDQLSERQPWGSDRRARVVVVVWDLHVVVVAISLDPVVARRIADSVTIV